MVILNKILLYTLLFFVLAFESLSAQFYFFGRNKVQYEDFTWKVIKTEHFNIYYYDDFEEMAEIGAFYAEEAYNDLKQKFNHVVTYRIPLIFYNTHIHFQQTNISPGFIPEGVGGFFEFLKGRVVIPYLGELAQFRHVIRHELVHVFMTSKLVNSLRDHRVPVDKLPPLWFVEGLAEFWSTSWDTQAEMVMRDAVLNNIFFPLEKLDYLRGFLMYKEGQNFLEWVKIEYGEDKVLRIMENYWRFTKFQDVLEYTLGEKLEKVSEKWSYHLKQRYFPLYEDKAPHHILSEKITDDGFNFSPVHLKKDGKDYIYFIGNYNGYSSIYRMEYTPGAEEFAEPEVVIQGEREAVFEAFHLLEANLAVSSGGDIAFIAKSNGNDVLYLYSSEDEEIKRSFEFNQLISIKTPSFSSSGDSLVFSAIDTKGFSDLFILDMTSGNLTRLLNDYYSDKDPVFSPDGNSVLFVSDRTEGIYAETFNLFRYNLKSRKTEYITYTDGNIGKPQFSPSGKEIFVISDYDGNYNLWKVLPGKNGEGKLEQITQFLTSVFDYTFISDDEIVTSGFERFSFQFYSLTLEPADSVIQTLEYNLDYSNGPWEPGKISLDSEDDRLVYEKEYTLDYAVSQVITDPVYGARGGAMMTLSDLMGDDRYVIFVYNTAEIRSEIVRNFNVAVSRVDLSGRTNYGYGIFNFSGRRYDIRESDDFYYERSFGGFFSLIYPFSSFNRIEASVSLANTDKELPEEAFISRKSLLLSNSISYVHDNALWGPTGPLDGSRFRILLGYTSDIKYSNENYYSFILDYRKYERLALRSTLALRGALMYNHGKNTRRYFAGGSWDLRGWPRWSIRGEKLWLGSVELRYPLIDEVYFKFPIIGLGFRSIRGAIFLDAGSAWDELYDTTLGSVGAGIRINFLNAIVFRYDIGKKIENNFNEFQNGLFYQFFFGYDF